MKKSNMTINDILFKEIKIAKFEFKVLDILFLISVLGLGFLLRYRIFFFESQDYIQNLQHWFREMDEAGGLLGLGHMVGNYTPPYNYFLAVMSHFPLSSLVAIKTLSVGFDFLLAVMIGLISYELRPNKSSFLFAFFATFFLPSVIMNSALWAQCDAIIMFFMASAIYLFMKNQPRWACFVFGFAIAIKIQAIFLAPILLFLWVDKRLCFKDLCMIPLAYLLSVVPTALGGGNYFDALTMVYWQVSTTSNDLSFNAANFWAPVRTMVEPLIASAATYFTLALTLASAYLLVSYKPKMTNKRIILLALFYCLLVPFFLPHMHERYYYYAEVFAIAYAVCNVKRYYIPICVSAVSVLSYCPFLFNIEPVSLNILAIVIFVNLVLVAKDIYEEFNSQNQ